MKKIYELMFNILSKFINFFPHKIFKIHKNNKVFYRQIIQVSYRYKN
jgi:hypothetical protein